MNFFEPTPIQAQAIPAAIAGKDILGSAQTGTGKTAAFGIPLIVNLLKNSTSSALVMTPTRELASQVMTQLQLIAGNKSPIKSALLIGGDSIQKQFRQLRKSPSLIVGTPGRITDHLKKKTLKLDTTNFLVLDETDRMLDMGFSEQIEIILKFMPKRRQTLLFSATIPDEIVKISKSFLVDPVRIAVNSKQLTLPKIKQNLVHTPEGSKYEKLISELNNCEGSIIVFMRTKYSTERMAAKLTKEGHKANAINGDLRQNKRDRVLRNFRNKKYRILVATDVASRGLDIPHIEHVINYDLPECPEDYIHRIGRTGRNGAEGNALCFITPSDKNKWNAIDRLINPGIKKKKDKRKPKSSKFQNFKNKNSHKAKSNKKNKFSNEISDKRKEGKKTIHTVKKKKNKIFRKRKHTTHSSAGAFT